MINPYDLGEIAENNQKIRINDLVKQVNSSLKTELLRSKIEVLGVRVQLATSKTPFGGDRIWFVCPICTLRRGVIYTKEGLLVGCRICLGLKYRKQRYRGMLELQSMTRL